MVRKSVLSIIIFSANILFGQLQSNEHIFGPSIGFSFLESTVQLGINHEYNMDINQLGIENGGIIGIGGIFRYWSYSEKFRDFQWDYTSILLGVQTNYHFYFQNDNIDPWLGFTMGYDFGNADLKITNSDIMVSEKDYGGIFIGAGAGIRYWLSTNLSISTRIGVGSSRYGALELGIDYQLK